MREWHAQTWLHLPRLGFTDACRLFGMTARALRFYEEKGLIEARRDRLNHRWYDGRARERLAWIARLRSVSLSLPDIRQVLEADERPGGARKVALAKLERRREALARELAQIDTLLPELRAEAEARPRAAA